MSICLYCHEVIEYQDTFEKIKSDTLHYQCFKLNKSKLVGNYTENHFLFDKIMWTFKQNPSLFLKYI
jgi:hypothetical protein